MDANCTPNTAKKVSTSWEEEIWRRHDADKRPSSCFRRRQEDLKAEVIDAALEQQNLIRLIPMEINPGSRNQLLMATDLDEPVMFN